MATYMYTLDRVNLMWNSIAYNNSRKFAFMTLKQRWIHVDRHFDNALQLLNFINSNSVSDVHVKPLDEGGREWVIDADFKNYVNKTELMLKINVGATALLLFFTEMHVHRIMFSGNRGFHMWLKFADGFKIGALKSVREHWYRIFEKPTRLNMRDIRNGSFAHCMQRAVNMYQDQILQSSKPDELILHFWPDVDKDVFCNPTKQIRAPFSYNHKGTQFSRCITQQLLEKIQKCSTGCSDGGASTSSISNITH
ncbi:LEF-1 [Epiphyas postvittana nucleopolyhedrovirus]|uniref:LEF-1 n=2 Tax=Epiphyas postvittana nucleopolyhedrovirus TaxID=70600 RepID=Q91GN6_NPVEP|nr:LEF-1 [Epiphyas postvittana nucleopolyhedrovirus]AAK85575.1 LEF-1 [Epiphyas postvittana nucleopolyhedrovirus]